MKNETMYFNDLLSIWLEKQKQARALSTYVKYRHLADRYISPYFRSIQLSKIDLPMLQTFRNSCLLYTSSKQFSRRITSRRIILAYAII